MAPQDKNPQHGPPLDAPASASGVQKESPATTATDRWRAFWDFFVLFSGISTRSNLSRTRKDPILSRGLFLFSSRKR
jgi:hypothetical protein